MKYKMFIFLILVFFCFCKDKEINKEENDDPFYISENKECLLNSNIKKNCLSMKSEFSCFKTLEDLSHSKIDKIFFNQKWMGNDQQTIFYQVDTKGKIKIYEGGPDVLLEERTLVGLGRFFIKNNQWYYEQSCLKENCENFEFQVLYMDCTLTTNLNEMEVLKSIQFGNRKFIESDEIENDKSYRLISFIQEKPVPNQIFNGFTSTKVPPIPSQ
ncbi:Hypothetical protein LBF_0964 [Leptospira biflexa serovar Patoc strain 'Patoc 1 (Ames)']|uniref:Uncharacterized protein n=1 Tax=Leptospira biflexa serovar Patoc (strain Patoc 1 / ATCC 23582 / Paris) TaxID=456481 RepID=B0SMH6_LEPBP|nr:hypothetical protein [Leptospira biflexa]ABZ93491.1 Hypothetical protein LBF_0964 [Leptospira biflexa serovar Patoc strain 'Patoc 1 (Ames)']ABZ97120.1 Hypothetical protein LEPBI_I0996 [Leptospira biflexa serovar Patoc strain 'Patoc 1 (Paris)']